MTPEEEASYQEASEAVLTLASALKTVIAEGSHWDAKVTAIGEALINVAKRSRHFRTRALDEVCRSIGALSADGHDRCSDASADSPSEGDS